MKKKSDCDQCKSSLLLNGTKWDDKHCSNIPLTYLEKEENGIDAKYIKCKNDNKCIGEWMVCDGEKDCPNGDDEDECTKEGCLAKKKWKCPGENKCLDEKFVCTSDTDKVGSLVYHRYHSLPRNKCSYNMDERNDHRCIDLCIEKGYFANEGFS